MLTIFLLQKPHGCALNYLLIWILKSKYFNPNDLLHGIEKNRIRWTAIFESFDDGCLEKIFKKNKAQTVTSPESQGWAGLDD